LTTNFLTAALSPTVWTDEVMFSDPAVNLRLLGRFTSSAWGAQSDQGFWSGYPPLYPLILSAWLWLAPISPTGVRSLNVILMALSCLAFWSALRRSQIIRFASVRLLFVTLILCGYSTTFSYRSGRADTIGVLIISLLALLVVCKPSGFRLALTFSLGALLPWAGLQLVVYAGVLIVLAVLITRTVPRFSIYLGAGVAVGGIALGLLYIATGTLAAFIASVVPYTMLASGGDRGRVISLTVVREFLITDYSTLFLLPIVAIATAMALRQRREERQLQFFFVLAIIIVPPALRVLGGHFPVYYFWMVFIPVSFLAAFIVDRAVLRRGSVTGAAFGLVCASIVAAILIGLPARLAIALIEAGERDYGPASSYVASVLNSEDTAFIDFPAYYPARLRAKKVYLPSYLRIISDGERRSVTVAILGDSGENPETFLSKEFGGDWEKSAPDYAPIIDRASTGFVMLAKPYHFIVLRRKTGLVSGPPVPNVAVP